MGKQKRQQQQSPAKTGQQQQQQQQQQKKQKQQQTPSPPKKRPSLSEECDPEHAPEKKKPRISVEKAAVVSFTPADIVNRVQNYFVSHGVEEHLGKTSRLCIKQDNIRDLLMWAALPSTPQPEILTPVVQGKQNSPSFPKVLMICISSLCEKFFLANTPDGVPPPGLFSTRVRVQTPGTNNKVYSFFDDLLRTPLKYTPKTAPSASVTSSTSPAVPTTTPPAPSSAAPSESSTPAPTVQAPIPSGEEVDPARLDEVIESLLLPKEYMDLMGFPKDGTQGFKQTKPWPADSATKAPKMLAVDCEMCSIEGGLLQLARVTVVGEDLKVVYDELVKPVQPIVDYNTLFSGITKEILEGAKKTIDEVQDDLIKLIGAETILIGHSLENDLQALHMCHSRVLDTVALYKKEGNKEFRFKLKSLAHLFLGETIQEGNHDSSEDAIATMKLALLKIRKVASHEETTEIARSVNTTEAKPLLFHVLGAGGVPCAFVDKLPIANRYSAQGLVNPGVIQLSNAEDDEATTVEAIKMLSMENPSKLIWAQYHSLETQVRLLEASIDGIDPPGSMENAELSTAIGAVFGHIARVIAAAPSKTLVVVQGGQGSTKNVKDLRKLREAVERSRATLAWFLIKE